MLGVRNGRERQIETPERGRVTVKVRKERRRQDENHRE